MSESLRLVPRLFGVPVELEGVGAVPSADEWKPTLSLITEESGRAYWWRDEAGEDWRKKAPMLQIDAKTERRLCLPYFSCESKR